MAFLLISLNETCCLQAQLPRMCSRTQLLEKGCVVQIN